MIKFNDLYKTYKNKNTGKTQALNGFSLEIKKNEVFALAGVNGAGKTTALKALFGLITLDKGNIEISDPDLIGFAPEMSDLPDYLTVEEVLKTSCNLVGVKPTQVKIDKSLEMFDLSDFKEKKVSVLSKGNRQRLSLAAATVYEPSIIVFDEPTSGLDPLGRKLIKNVMKQFKAEGRTLLFTTHILTDLPDLCDRLAVVDEGRVVFSGTITEFSSDTSLNVLEDRFAELVGKGK